METSAVRFSIIIPTHDRFPLLKQALESILAQHYPRHRLQLIVVDDGSCRQHFQALEAFWEKDIAKAGFGSFLLLRNSHCKGVAQARNHALRFASGMWLAWLDDDDVWEPEKLLLCDKWIAENPELVLIAHGYHLMGDTSPARRSPRRRHVITLDKLLWGNRYVLPGIVIRRMPGLEFDSNLQGCEDFDYWIRCLAQSGQSGWFEPLLLCGIGRPQGAPGGLSAHRWRMKHAELKVLARACSRRPYWGQLLPVLLWGVVRGMLASLRAWYSRF